MTCPVSVRRSLMAGAAALLIAMFGAACDATETNVSSSDAVETNVNRPGICGGDAAPCEEDAGQSAQEHDKDSRITCEADADCARGYHCGRRGICTPDVRSK